MRRTTDALRHVPQSAPMRADQVRNRAGGFVWAVDAWALLDRFLILGTSQPTYYASARTLTLEAADGVAACLAEDGPRVVDQVVAVSDAGRAPSNEPALFALAMALKLGDPATRRRAREALPSVARTLAHVYGFAEAVDALGGWGRGTRRAFVDWLIGRDARALAYQALKYRQRDGWTLRDVLRKVHVRAPTSAHHALFGWATHGSDVSAEAELAQLDAFVRVQGATTPADAVRAIVEHDLPREAIPTHLLGDRTVWAALLERMPATALLRSLGKLGAVGLLTSGSEAAATVTRRLTSADGLRRARVHPLGVLVAQHTYRGGHGVKGSLTWPVVRAVSVALEQAFHASFGVLRPTGRRHLLALDVSGSMGCGGITGLSGITPRVASAAMAMVARRVEPSVQTVGFSHELTPLDVARDASLDGVLQAVDRMPMGGTDCALPMLWAARERVPIDVFVVYTDNETWFGGTHPSRALKDYRQRMGIDAKLVVVGMVANGFTIADPADGGMLDVVGFDTAAPRVMADFASA